MVTCEICGETHPIQHILNHLRVMHPDHYEEPDTWPDGGPVIVDIAPDPRDLYDT